jgi:pyocin large subunit-like protein
MSLSAMVWALRVRAGSTTAKAVLVALADCHNDHTGDCYPSIQRLADICECSRRTVVRALEDLESAGLLTKRGRVGADGSQTSNAYDLHIGAGDPCVNLTPPLCHSDTPPVSQCHPNLESESSLSKRARETGLLVGTFSKTVPVDWQPDSAIERMARVQPGVDREHELAQFRLHEFVNGKTDWDRAWAQWLTRAKPRQQAQEARKTTIQYQHSTHPSVVAERRSQEDDDAMYRRMGYRNREAYERGERA